MATLAAAPGWHGVHPVAPLLLAVALLLVSGLLLAPEAHGAGAGDPAADGAAADGAVDGAADGTAAGGAVVATAGGATGLEAIPPLSEDDYLETRNCLHLRRVDKTRVPDTDRILFYDRNGEVWMSQLKSACQGLDDNRALWFDVHGTRVCQSDRVVVTDRFTDGMVMGNCILGPFERVTVAQAEALMAQPPRNKRPGLLRRLFRREDGGTRDDG